MGIREKVADYLAGLASTPEAASKWPCCEADATMGLNIEILGADQASNLYWRALDFASDQGSRMARSIGRRLKRRFGMGMCDVSRVFVWVYRERVRRQGAYLR